MSLEASVSQVVNESGLSSGSIPSVKLGYGFSLQDSVNFSNAYQKASEKIQQNNSPVSTNGIETLQTLLSPLNNLNQGSINLLEQTSVAEAQDFKPSDMINLTMKSHEFLFQCEITANVANRSSDGIQQLFRQQS